MAADLALAPGVHRMLSSPIVECLFTLLLMKRTLIINTNSFSLGDTMDFLLLINMVTTAAKSVVSHCDTRGSASLRSPF